MAGGRFNNSAVASRHMRAGYASNLVGLKTILAFDRVGFHWNSQADSTIGRLGTKKSVFMIIVTAQKVGGHDTSKRPSQPNRQFMGRDMRWSWLQASWIV